jgi:hypothetical protein
MLTMGTPSCSAARRGLDPAASSPALAMNVTRNVRCCPARAMPVHCGASPLTRTWLSTCAVLSHRAWTPAGSALAQDGRWHGHRGGMVAIHLCGGACDAEADPAS